MIKRKHFTALLAIAVVVWAGVLYMNGVPVYSALLKPFSWVVTAVALIWEAFDRWIWRWKFLHPWFVTRPDLNGTWKGRLTSNWSNPTTGQPTPSREAYLVVRQTYSNIDMRLFTRESSSETLAAQIIEDAVGIHTIAAVYRNVPKMLNRDHSQMHNGAVLLHVRGNPPISLDGGYWTDRETKGEIELETRNQHLANDFDHASTLHYGRRATAAKA